VDNLGFPALGLDHVTFFDHVRGREKLREVIMAALIHSELRECDRRLSQYFNTTRNQWIEVVKAAVAARASCTDDNPLGAPGYRAWDAGTARMRRIFRKEGWDKDDQDGVPSIVHRELKKKIVVMNTDIGTADRFRSPRNRTVKGPATEKIADLNNQLEMFRRHEISREPADPISTWHLCIFDDGKLVRCELSRPVLFKSGFFLLFSERIFILRPGDWEKVSIATPADQPAQPLQITVRRK
jgi:hypothetical protein